MYSTSEITDIYNRNIDMVYRICYLHTKNKFEAEDLSQNVFVRLLKQDMRFENAEHEKAWLIRAAVNRCKDFHKSFWRKVMLSSDNQDEFTGVADPPHIDETLEKVLGLPEKYKTTLYLYYYEGYNTTEIARITRRHESTVRTHLSRGRSLLREAIENDEEEHDYGAETSF